MKAAMSRCRRLARMRRDRRRGLRPIAGCEPVRDTDHNRMVGMARVSHGPCVGLPGQVSEPIQFMITGPADAGLGFLCAHGAGAGMETPFLGAIAALLAERGLTTYRFEFAYMAARRQGTRKPPPKAERLMQEYRA